MLPARPPDCPLTSAAAGGASRGWTHVHDEEWALEATNELLSTDNRCIHSLTLTNALTLLSLRVSPLDSRRVSSTSIMSSARCSLEFFTRCSSNIF